MQVLEPICINCKRLIMKPGSVYSCTVFPDGIPREIVENKHDHSEKHFKNADEKLYMPVDENYYPGILGLKKYGT